MMINLPRQHITKEERVEGQVVDHHRDEKETPDNSPKISAKVNYINVLRMEEQV